MYIYTWYDAKEKSNELTSIASTATYVSLFSVQCKIKIECVSDESVDKQSREVPHSVLWRRAAVLWRGNRNHWSLSVPYNTLSMFWTILMYPWKEASYVQFFSHRHRTLFVPSVLFCSKYSGDKESHPATAAPCPGGMRRELRQVSRGSGGQPGFPCGEGPRRCFVSSMKFFYCFCFLQGAVCFMFAQVCCALLQYCTM